MGDTHLSNYNHGTLGFIEDTVSLGTGALFDSHINSSCPV